MKSFIIVSFTVLLSLPASYSQKKEQRIIKKSNLLGINIGATTGVGISYKHWHNKIGFQISGLPIKIRNNFDFNIGITSFYSIKNKKYVNMFVYSGHNLMTDKFNFKYRLSPLFFFIKL